MMMEAMAMVLLMTTAACWADCRFALQRQRGGVCLMQRLQYSGSHVTCHTSHATRHTSHATSHTPLLKHRDAPQG
jgi:hypothetical protein